MSVITLLLPDFSLILLGCLLLRQPGLSASFWSGIEKLVYYYLFPALLFYSSARLNFQFSSIWKFLSCAVLASGAAILLAYLGGNAVQLSSFLMIRVG